MRLGCTVCLGLTLLAPGVVVPAALPAEPVVSAVPVPPAAERASVRPGVVPPGPVTPADLARGRAGSAGTAAAPAAPAVPAAATTITGIGKVSFRQILALQVGLDRLHFSPGCLDGKLGGQTRLAIQAWQLAHDQSPTGELAAADLAQFGTPEDAVAPYTVTAADLAELVPAPKTWKEKSEMARLGHNTILELISEAFHCKEDLLRRLNPDVDWSAVKAGAVLTVPDPQAGAAPLPMAAWLQVNLEEKTIRACDSRGRILAHFPCSIARKAEKRPSGEAKVVAIAPNPTYTYDPALFADEEESKLYKGKMMIPAGPNNPVGVAWIGLDLPGYGMHGTPKPEDIGKTGSHGCFRLANWNAAKLLQMVTLGTPVKFAP